MKKRIIGFFSGTIFGAVLAIVLMATINPLSNPLSNQLVNSVLWYQTSEEKKAIYYQAFNWAKQIVDQHLQNNNSQKPLAVIVDIDETMLDNSPYEARLVHYAQTYNPQSWDKWVNEKKAEPLPGAVEFSKYLKEKGVELFYVSNRRQHLLQPTIENLKKHGFEYADSAHILLRTSGHSKKARRDKILKKYNVILYIGDQMGDFNDIYVKGTSTFDKLALKRDKKLFGTKYIILPNPMYGIWEYKLFPKDKKLSDQDKALLKIQQLKTLEK